MHISVVSPVYKAPAILPELVDRLTNALTKITDSFEIILVDDGCPLNSWEVIEILSQKHTNIKGIKLSRNFGQHYAIAAGIDLALGQWIIVMDCDLQDSPEDIPSLYNTCILENYDTLVVSSSSRNQNIFKDFTSSLFRRIFNFLTDANLEKGVGNFGIYHKNVIDAVKQMGDSVRVFSILVKWVGFNRGIIQIDRAKRAQGVSSYTFLSLITLAFNIGIAHSDKILKITLFAGVFFCIMSLTYSLYTVYNYFLGGISVPGYTSIVIITTLIGGMTMTFLGLIGVYITKMFHKIKNRPNYIVAKSI